MSWIQKLYETYLQCAANAGVAGVDFALEPICHTSQQAHIEVRIDGNGTFLGAKVIEKTQAVTLVPCTEASVGRVGKKPVNHPLCDKLQYLAADFTQYGGEVTSGYAADPAEPHVMYMQSLGKWAGSAFSHPKLNAIHTYLERGRLIADLVAYKILPVESVAGKTVLLKEWHSEISETPKIFSVMANGNTPATAFIRWCVESPGDLFPETWKDQSLIAAWIDFYLGENESRGLCLATGNTVMLAAQHAAKVRHGADKAKIISSNDTSGFTFRGRFADAAQACAVGFDVSQKAHNALRWLIRRQAFRNGDQVVVAWAVSGRRLPNPLADSFALFADDAADAADIDTDEDARAVAVDAHSAGDAGQAFGLRLAKLLAGYGTALGVRNEIVVMALDSATTGRLAITYYREFDFPEFVSRIESWHIRYAWHQNFGKDKKFIGAPAPRDIAEASYGMRLDDKLRKSAVERLLPCIMDGVRLPQDLMASSVRRAINRIGLDHWEWEKCLGIACGLFKGFYLERNYQMALEPERTSRDYLYGRLLAIADNIERFALDRAKESRETSAARLMQRFADHPCATWRNIELSLVPYKARLRTGAAGFVYAREKLLTEVAAMFEEGDFIADRKLSGEFLLGYHCQRQAFLHKPDAQPDTGDTGDIATINSNDAS
jgi:CRISPR-associated protein Csd1